MSDIEKMAFDFTMAMFNEDLKLPKIVYDSGEETIEEARDKKAREFFKRFLKNRDIFKSFIKKPPVRRVSRRPE